MWMNGREFLAVTVGHVVKGDNCHRGHIHIACAFHVLPFQPQYQRS